MPNHCYYLAISFTNHLYLYSLYLLARHAFALFERTTSYSASERSELTLSRVQLRFLYYWRASVASETLTGVTQSKIGDVYLFIYLFVYMYGRMYVILYFDPRVFVLVMW